MTYSDSGFTWEADPRHTELAVAEIGLQAARPQMSASVAKPNAPLNHEEMESDRKIAYHSLSTRLEYLQAQHKGTQCASPLL